MVQNLRRNRSHRYTNLKTVHGNYWIACSPDGITTVRPETGTAALFEEEYLKTFGIRPLNRRIPDTYKQAIRSTLNGRPYPPVPIDWRGFTDFQRKVLKKLTKVPAGEVRTYSWLARQIGNPKSARAVGNVMARNPIPFLIPCHRIVPSTGGIGNYGLGSKLKRALLEKESRTSESRKSKV
jgi:O-6-methylguanine DNA methyltransferase